MQQFPRDLWRYRVPSLDVADLSTPERLARVGLVPPRPGRRGWPAFQNVGEALWQERWQRLLAPSAARADGLVLCLFVGDPAVLPAQPVAALVTEPPVPPTGMRT